MPNHLEDERYLTVVLYGIWAALSAHILFGLFALAIGAYPLAVFNVLSIATYVGCAWLAKRGHITAGIMLITTEVILHAWLAVALLGWASGFHFYIIVLMLLSAFHPHWPIGAKIGYAVFVCASYLALSQFYLWHAPDINISIATLELVRWFNITMTFGFVGYLAHFYAKVAREAEIRLEALAATDSLTGLYNRRQMLDAVDQELIKQRRNPTPLAVMLLDIDNFKTLNDRYGHECGDNALRALADAFRQTLRTQDHVARWGGEEFLMLLPDTNLAGAQVLAEKVRETAHRIAVDTGGSPVGFTITAAVGEFYPREDFDRCLSRIDHGLLEGKRAGKNRVVVVEQ